MERADHAAASTHAAEYPSRKYIRVQVKKPSSKKDNHEKGWANAMQAIRKHTIKYNHE